MSLNNKEVMEALLAGKVLVDTYNKNLKLRLNNSTLEILDAIKGWQTWIDDNITLLDWKLEPETININGHEVPRPLDKINKGEDYYLIDLNSAKLYKHGIWKDLYYLTEFLRRGLVHSTRNNCIKHAEALLSFTQEGR